MGKIKNTSVDNVHGGGKEQVYISDSGKSYRIKNSALDNVHGDGKEKIIVEDGAGDGLANLLAEIVPWWVWVIFFIVIRIVQETCFN